MLFKNFKIFCLYSFLFLGLSIFPSAVFASITDGTILTATSTDGFAWGENVGWINFTASSSNIHITSSNLTGYMWDSVYGWVNLNPTNSGVLNDGQGNLSGYAWSSGAGFINFNGVTINSSGKFTGQAQGSIYGRINFDCTSCNVVTDWRPIQVIVAPTGGGGGGSLFQYYFDLAKANTAVATSSIATTTESILPKDFCFNKNLDPYMSDADVKYLQIFLNAGGFKTTEKGQENNYYGLETISGIRLFQKDNGITTTTGNFGNITRKKVNDILGCKTITVTIATTTQKAIIKTPEISNTAIPEIITKTINQTSTNNGQNQTATDTSINPFVNQPLLNNVATETPVVKNTPTSTSPASTKITLVDSVIGSITNVVKSISTFSHNLWTGTVGFFKMIFFIK